MSEVGTGWPIDEPPEFYGIDPTKLISLVPAAGYRSILLPRWFPLEQAPNLEPDDQHPYVGFWRWSPTDALSRNAQPPHWSLGSPWAESVGVDYDDHRALAPDVSLDELSARTHDLLGAPHTLSPRTYKIAWSFASNVDEGATWVELPLLGISPS